MMRRLRDETADLHAAAERHVRILDPDATDATYGRYLSRMLGFQAPMEARFAAHGGLAAVGFDATARRRQHLLRADLAWLGRGEPEHCPDLPPLDDLASALGAAYVIEGAALGGRFILSRMRPRLGHLVGVATRFLEGHRESTGPLWRAFGAIVESQCANADAGDRAVASARATFQALTVWLDEPAADPPHRFRPRRPEARA